VKPQPLRRRLQLLQQARKVPWEVLERDYLFSWVLAAIGKSELLRNTLVFKGGACLKKCYFGDYRFSEDLDFSCLELAPQGSNLEEAFQQVCREAEELLQSSADVRLECVRYTEREAHPHGQEAFIIRGRLPWQSKFQTRVLIEVTREEYLLWPAEQRPLLHEYGDELVGSLVSYSLSEIVAEKLRAILQQTAKQGERNWLRPRVRDYYDLWRILSYHTELFALPDFEARLRQKCASKDVAFADLESFFSPMMTAEVERVWVSWMTPIVPDLPEWNQVLSELRPLVARLLGQS